MQSTGIYHPLQKLKLLHTIKESLGTLYFYDKVVIWEANPQTKVNYISGFSILVKSLNYLKPTPWVLISHRKNEYEVDASGFQYIALAPFLKGAAIVSKKHTQKDAEQLGKKYLNKPLQVSSSLEVAYQWALTLV